MELGGTHLMCSALRRSDADSRVPTVVRASGRKRAAVRHDGYTDGVVIVNEMLIPGALAWFASLRVILGWAVKTVKGVVSVLRFLENSLDMIGQLGAAWPRRFSGELE